MSSLSIKEQTTSKIQQFFKIDSFSIEESENVAYAKFTGIMPEQGREYSSESEDSMRMFDRMLLNRSAKLWRNILLFFPAVVNALPKEDSVILELGCSVCNLRTYLYRNGPETFYIGLDARKDVLQEAMREILTRPYGLVEYDLNLEWPFEYKVFDVVAFYDTIEHLPDRETQLRVLKGIYESLKDDGILLLATTYKDAEGNNSYEEFHTSEIDKETFEEDVVKLGYFIDETFALDFHDSHEDWQLSFAERKLMSNLKARGFHTSAIRAIFATQCHKLPRNVFYRLMKAEDTLKEDLAITKRRFLENEIGLHILSILETEINGIKFLNDYVRLTLSSGDELYVFDRKNNSVKIETKVEFVEGIAEYKMVTNSACIAELSNKHEVTFILKRLLQ